LLETHSWLEPHTEQGLPPLPQAVPALPGTHWPLLSQQPVVQLDESQVMVVFLHWPPEQASPPWHEMQALPPLPQANSELPCWHLPLVSQQPEGQLAELQTSATHFLFSHFSLFLQVLQPPPPEPQARGWVPATQPNGAQHPEPQVAGPQGRLTHLPAWQFWVEVLQG